MSDLSSKNILVIQTAFIGDTILASSFLRALKVQFPEAKLHFFLRKGNESVIQGLETVHKVWIWDKNGGKTKNLLKLISQMRETKFDMVFNLHRHFNSGLVTAMMRSPLKVGFRQNPLSFFYDQKVNHQIPHFEGSVLWHEVQRNLLLLKKVCPELEIDQDATSYPPELPLLEKHFDKISPYAQGSYFVMAPASVWFTKAWSESKYQALADKLTQVGKVYLIGSPDDVALCERIRNHHPQIEVLAGKLSLLDSAALMKKALRVFVNDSAPLHLASAVGAKMTAIFCSTIKDFGYFPLSKEAKVIEVQEKLSCRPCGLHGKKSCPLEHFDCSEKISIERVFKTVDV